MVKPPLISLLDGLIPEPVIAGKDCLNLNIWTPAEGKTELPVMVWIHGGGFTNGTGAAAMRFDLTAKLVENSHSAERMLWEGLR